MDKGMEGKWRGLMLSVAGAAFVLSAGWSATASAQANLKLPKLVTVTAYGTTAAGYRQTVSVGKALKERLGTTLRILPGENDVTRTKPLLTGRAQMTATGAGIYSLQEGVYNFAATSWGPQGLRLVAMSVGDSNLTLGVAEDTGVTRMSDMRGKRVMWIRGGPALNHNIKAMLAFGGLTWNDVERVEFSGYASGWRGVLSNQVDGGFAITTSGIPNQVYSSPRGLVWPPLPASDKEGWARLKAVAPYFEPHIGTLGAGLSSTNTHEGGVYPYPMFAVYDTQDDALVYNMARAVVELYDDYADPKVGSNGFALERQIFKWAVPFHDAAAKYYAEIGSWTADMSAHNDVLKGRQAVLKAAWGKYKQAFGWRGDDAFQKGWLEVRKEALLLAGLAPVYD